MSEATLAVLVFLLPAALGMVAQVAIQRFVLRFGGFHHGGLCPEQESVVRRIPVIEGLGVAPGVASLAWVLSVMLVVAGRGRFQDSTIINGPLSWKLWWVVGASGWSALCLFLLRLIFKRECQMKATLVADVKHALVAGDRGPISPGWWNARSTGLTRHLGQSRGLRALALTGAWFCVYATLVAAYF